MSLLSDPDFLIHRLRLSYLRHVDDPYGPRILSLNPAYSSNPHIIASGLADPEAWPELGLPSTPPLEGGELANAGNDKKRHPGGANLKYTQTIVGQNRVGGMGMRVNARRVSSIKDSASPIITREDVDHHNGKRLRSDSEPTPAPASPNQEVDTHPDKPISNTVLKRSSADMTTLEQAPAPLASELEQRKPGAFRPPFARAAEMEARRRPRPHFHNASTETHSQPRRDVPLQKESYNPEISDNEDLSDDDEASDLDGNDDEGFSDPDGSFGPHIVLDGSVSDGILSTSNSGGLSTSPSSGVDTYAHLHPNARRAQARLRLDSLDDKRPSQSDSAIATDQNAKHDAHPRRTIKTKGSYFELVSPPFQNRNAQAQGKQASGTTAPAERLPHAYPMERPEPQPHKLTFTRVKVPPVPSTKTPSALSLMLASHGSKPENPFAELYSLISSRSNPLTLEVVYPFSDHKDPVTLRVRSDATVEEVIGFGLWTYWEEGFTPKLDDCDEAKKRDRLTAAGWSLRVTEDGEVDDDFPAFDRMAKMSKFSFEGYAILPETPSQTEQNRITESKIVRRSSRVMLAKKKDTTTQQTLAPPPSTLHPGSLASHVPMSSSIGGGSSISQGPQQLLKIRFVDKADVQNTVPIYKTIPVKESMYMEEVLENVCRRYRIEDPKQWCLVYDMKILIPLDRTVASLQGKTELYLVKTENLAQYDIEKQQTRSTDPNASIFSGTSDVPERENNGALDFTKAYKKYTVYRKMPMLVVRHERILAIDGDYVHIMPVATRAFLDSMKTSSYHIKSISGCTQSAKSSNFKLAVARDGGTKRYDFEAESPRIAAEIVRTIRDLRNKRPERASTMTRSRRSKAPQ